MEMRQAEYEQLMGHIKDLKCACDKLKVNLRLIEFPIQLDAGDTATQCSSESSAESSESADSSGSESSASS